MSISFAASAFLSLALVAPPGIPNNCDLLPTLEISDPGISRAGGVAKTERVLDGTVTKDLEPFRFAAVLLYSGKKVIRQTRTDAQGHFVLERLPRGLYILSIQGMGDFKIEVTPPHLSQQFFYSFNSTQGCLDWGMSTD